MAGAWWTVTELWWLTAEGAMARAAGAEMTAPSRRSADLKRVVPARRPGFGALKTAGMVTAKTARAICRNIPIRSKMLQLF